MTKESKIFAKEEQIKLLDNILCSLCSVELTNEGRKFLKKMKQRISQEIIQLKYIESQQLNESTISRSVEKSLFRNASKSAW